MTPELIIFDCDGTLADTEATHQIAVIRALSECGFPNYDMDFCTRHFVGRGMTYVQYFVEEREGKKLPDDFLNRYVRICHEIMAQGVVPLPYAVEAVKILSQSYKVCVASNGESETVLKTITSMGMLDIFGEDHIYTKSQVARGKPAPDLFLFAAKQMNVAPEKCIVIEDSMAGVQAGLAAGMLTIGITAVSHDAAFTEENMKKIGVEHIFSTWAEIVAFINEK